MHFVTVLGRLFVLNPTFTLPVAVAATPVVLVVIATLIAFAAQRLVNRLEPTELLRDE